MHGVGVGGFSEPADVIDCGNSGTGVRLIMGCMATTAMTATFTGDASLRKRPDGPRDRPAVAVWRAAYGRAGGRLPMTVVGAANPVPVRYATPVASAQVKSAILLAGLNAPGETVVIEREATRDHSERMLAGLRCDAACREDRRRQRDHADGSAGTAAAERGRAARPVHRRPFRSVPR